MREINKIAEALFEKIRDRFEDVSLGDENAKATQDPQAARFFNFDYAVDGQNYGNVTLSLIDEMSLKIYFSKNISSSLDEDHKKKWYDFLRELRNFARSNLLSFEPRDITRSTLKHRDVQQQSKADSTYNKDEVIGESRLYGTSRSSYENFGPVRIIVRHDKAINNEQRGARSRHINSVYVETAEGERFKMPFKSLTASRAMARHISAGGTPHDELGQHICEITAEAIKLKPFLNNVRRRTFEDQETHAMVEAAFEYHGLLNNTLQRMSGRKGYTACKEQFETTASSYAPDEDMDVAAIKERFVKRVYNDKMEDALPLVHKAYNMKKNNKFAQQFESWANNIAEGTWAKPDGDKEVADLIELFGEPLVVGVDAQNATNALYNIIGDDVLYDQLESLAEQNPEADARDVVMAWLESNMPEVYGKIMSAIGDQEPADQYEGTCGASGMDEPNVNEGWNTGSDRVSLPDEPSTYWAGKGQLQADYNRLYDELVPSQGKADTIEGEVLRASSKIVYRHYNDGDEFNQASFDQLEPYIGTVTSYDDLAHKAIEFALKANGNYTPNPNWDSLDVMDYGPAEEEYDDEEDDDYDDWSNNVDTEEEDDEDLAEGGNYDEDQVESIQTAIIRRITNNIGQHQELLMKAGPDGVMNAARDVASFHAPVEELGSSDISIMVREVYREVGVEYPELAEGKMKEVDMDLTELSDEEFQAKYGKSKEEMKAALAENVGDDVVNKDEKLKRMGAKPLNFLDKLKTIPQGIKAIAKDEPEDDVSLYNKQFEEDIEQMRRIAGLK